MGIVTLSRQKLETLMSQETTDNLLEAMRSFQWMEPVPVSYRLYHDDQGHPMYYTMEDLPGSYIEVDQATYILGSHHVRVLDGKLKILPRKTSVTKLMPDAESGIACDPRDICVIVSEHQPNQRWRLSTDDQD